MRERCGTAAEYLGCRTLPDELESGGQEMRFEGGPLSGFVPAVEGTEAYLSSVSISVPSFIIEEKKWLLF